MNHAMAGDHQRRDIQSAAIHLLQAAGRSAEKIDNVGETGLSPLSSPEEPARCRPRSDSSFLAKKIEIASLVGLIHMFQKELAIAAFIVRRGGLAGR